MALLPTRTYSRRDNELSAVSDREKENVDPFDELLTSPLKQNVQFLPLSYWGKKERDKESKKKSRTLKYGLFETSDSDESNSPFQRKRKAKSKNLASKRTLQPKSLYSKLRTRKSIISNSAFYSLNETKRFVHSEKFEKDKDKLLDKTLYSNKNEEEAFNFDSTRGFNRDKKRLKSPKKSYSSLNSVSFQTNKRNSKGFANRKINPNLKIFKDIDTSQKQPGKTLDANIKSLNNTVLYDEGVKEMLKPFKDRNSFKYITLKRQFNYPTFYSLPDANFYSFNLIGFNESQNCSNQLESSCRLKVNTYEDISVTVDCVNDSGEINFVEEDSDDDDDDDDGECFIDNTLQESLDETFGSVNSTTLINERSETVSIQECKIENPFPDSFYYNSFKISKPKDLIQELEQNENTQYPEELNLHSTSDDTFSGANNEDTVISAVKPETSHSLDQDSEEEEIVNSASPSSGVSQLTSRISDLNISNPADDKLSGPEPEKSKIGSSAAKEDSFLIDLRNVTTKRRGFLNNRYDDSIPCHSRLRSSTVFKNIQKENNSRHDTEFDQTLQFSDRMSIEWNKTVSFANPMFESTRVLDMGVTDRKESLRQNLSETFFGESALDHTYFLKPGKKWLRSISVLKQIQNGNISESRHDVMRKIGRKFESFVQDMVELQNGNCRASSKIEVNVQNSSAERLSDYESILNVEDESEMSEFFSINDSIQSAADKTISEKVLLNRTVKVIQPEEGSSAFRSALGLETSHVISQVTEYSIREESSCISARNFILLQCGQEDVLPFEEYFNERTLINCKKIGEGVYGEVFMCSNTVIKIIPIEGLDKVNGEPQKTFTEIISEVVIASKLSSLRNGEKHQTEGFSEMKRCWCVKGKYPKYLLDLWNEYDELGSGSENDSPIMFKDDQLYIILELANGGKDLESFVFNSAAQSLSVFIQAAFSLAVAEKAFEFEHRDLHWGNVLISETKDKFMTVILDGIEYKIPTKGVKVCIIDFTLSRVNHEGCCIFNDLSVDPTLFGSEGDYQFEIYRMMLREVKNDWSLFRPKNNLFWLHYMLDKMIKMVRYKNKKAKVHAKHLKELKALESVVLDHHDSTDFVLSSSLSNIMSKL